MQIVSIGYNTEVYLTFLKERYENETGDEITVAQILDSIVKLTFQEIYGFSETLEIPDEGEAYFGVTIPFSKKVEAEYGLERVRGKLGYGGWIREGNFNEDD